MKYLFVVQGEGRGHLTQAISLSQMLQRNGHEVVEVLVGKCSNRELPSFFYEKIEAPVYRFNSPSIDYGKKGKKGKILKSIIINTTPTKVAKWTRSIDLIVSRINRHEPDVIINFYEFLMGFSSIIHRIKPPVISIAHQFLLDHPDYKFRPRSDHGLFMLRLYNIICSIGTTKTLALSFYKMKDSYKDRIAVVPPLLRESVTKLKPKDDGYLLGYMLNSGYLDEILEWKAKNQDIKLHLFWDKKDAPEEQELQPNLWLHRINDVKFLEYMEGCSGYVTTAGFESVCEALYLGKPILMIPAHIEQQINAADAKSIGAGISCDTFDISKLIEFIPEYNSPSVKFNEWESQAEELFIRHLTTLV